MPGRITKFKTCSLNPRGRNHTTPRELWNSRYAALGTRNQHVHATSIFHQERQQCELSEPSRRALEEGKHRMGGGGVIPFPRIANRGGGTHRYSHCGRCGSRCSTRVPTPWWGMLCFFNMMTKNNYTTHNIAMCGTRARRRQQSVKPAGAMAVQTELLQK